MRLYNQDLHQLVEDDPVGDARPVADQWVRRRIGREKGRKLIPDGLDEE
jgi:hypothetical protein